MYKTITVLIRVLFLGLLFMMTMFLATKPVHAMDMEPGHDMSSHHQHMMLNHALGMTLEGYNMVMPGNMDMAGDVDEAAVEHGNMMIKNGSGFCLKT